MCSMQWTCAVIFFSVLAVSQCGIATASSDGCATLTTDGELLTSHELTGVSGVPLDEDRLGFGDDYDDDEALDDTPSFMQGTVQRMNTSKEAAMAAEEDVEMEDDHPAFMQGAVLRKNSSREVAMATHQAEDAKLLAAKAEAMRAEAATLEATKAAAEQMKAAQAQATRAEAAVLQTAKVATARIEAAKAEAAKAEALVADVANADVEAASDVTGDSPAFVQGVVLRRAGLAGRGLAHESMNQGLQILPANLSVVEPEVPQQPSQFTPPMEPMAPALDVGTPHLEPRAPAYDAEAPRPVMPEPLIDRPSASSLAQTGVAASRPHTGETKHATVATESAPAAIAAPSPPAMNASQAAGQNPSINIAKLPPRYSEYRIRDLRAGCLALVIIIFGLGFVLKKYLLSKGRSGSDASTRRRVEKLRISSGTEIRSMFAMSAPAPERPQPVLPLRPGMLMRVQGRVVSRPGCTMMAPLSGRACVMYSASASQHQHGGVHQAPVAYHSATSGFGIELDNLPDAILDVKGEDVLLFDMMSGRFAQEEHFSEAPEAWRAFVMAHLLTGAGGDCRSKMNHVDLAAKGLLEFRECALVVGAMVTCVGEVSRESDGRLALGPWSPPAAPSSPSSSARAVPWMTPDNDVLVQRLMVSDDACLLDKAPPWQTLARTLMQ